MAFEELGLGNAFHWRGDYFEANLVRKLDERVGNLLSQTVPALLTELQGKIDQESNEGVWEGFSKLLNCYEDAGNKTRKILDEELALHIRLSGYLKKDTLALSHAAKHNSIPDEQQQIRDYLNRLVSIAKSGVDKLNQERKMAWDAAKGHDWLLRDKTLSTEGILVNGIAKYSEIERRIVEPLKKLMKQIEHTAEKFKEDNNEQRLQELGEEFAKAEPMIKEELNALMEAEKDAVLLIFALRHDLEDRFKIITELPLFRKDHFALLEKRTHAIIEKLEKQMKSEYWKVMEVAKHLDEVAKVA